MEAGAMMGPSSALTSVETSDPTPLAARRSLPAWVVTIKVRMPGVRNMALVRSTLPLPLTTTWSGGAVFFKASGPVVRIQVAGFRIYAVGDE